MPTTTSSTTTTQNPLVNQLNQLLSKGKLHKVTRFTRLVVVYPESLTLPYNEHNGVPYVAREEPIRNIVDYSISASDTMAAAQININALNDTQGLFSFMLEHYVL